MCMYAHTGVLASRARAEIAHRPAGGLSEVAEAATMVDGPRDCIG